GALGDAVVADARAHPRQGLHGLAEVGPPAVVLEAGDRADAQHRRALAGHLAHRAALAPVRAQVEDAQSRIAAAVGVERLAEQLVARADPQDRPSGLGGLAGRAVVDQSFGGARLRAVLAAADEVEVGAVRDVLVRADLH